MTRVLAVLPTATGDLALINELARQPRIDLRVLFSYADKSGRGEHGEIDFEFQYLKERLVLRTDVQKGNRLVLNSGLATAVRGASPDVLLIGGYGNLAGLRSILIAERRRIPWVLFSENQASMRGSRSFAKAWLIRSLVGRASGFVVLGADGERFIRSMGGTGEAVTIASNRDLVAIARRVDQCRSALPARRDVRFLCVSRLVEQKGVDVLLDAFPAVVARNPGVELVVAGGGPLGERLRDMSSRTPGLVWLGTVPFQELPGVFAAADVLVLPSRSETWGHVVAEAMAAKLPVIGSVGAGSVRFLVEPQVGWRVRPGDRGSLEHAMDEAARADVRSMGEQARAAVMRYDARLGAQDVATLLARVAGPR